MQTEFEPRNPNYDSAVRDSFSRQPYMADIGARIDLIDPGVCEMSLGLRPGLTQQHGFFHGGLVAALADSAAGYACYSLFPENSTILTTEFKVNFLNPSQGARLRARGRVLKTGKTLFVCQADVYSDGDSGEKHCLTGLFTMMCLMGKSDALNLGREVVST